MLHIGELQYTTVSTPTSRPPRAKLLRHVRGTKRAKHIDLKFLYTQGLIQHDSIRIYNVAIAQVYQIHQQRNTQACQAPISGSFCRSASQTPMAHLRGAFFLLYRLPKKGALSAHGRRMSGKEEWGRPQ